MRNINIQFTGRLQGSTFPKTQNWIKPKTHRNALRTLWAHCSIFCIKILHMLHSTAILHTTNYDQTLNGHPLLFKWNQSPVIQ